MTTRRKGTNMQVQIKFTRQISKVSGDSFNNNLHIMVISIVRTVFDIHPAIVVVCLRFLECTHTI